MNNPASRSMPWLPVLILFSLLVGYVGALGFGGKQVGLLWADLLISSVAVVMSLNLLKDGAFTSGRYHVVFGALIVTALLSLYNAPDLLKGLGYIKGIVVGILAFWIVLNHLRSRRQIEDLWSTLPLWTLGLCAMIVVAVMRLDAAEVGETGRAEIRTPLGASNYLAAFLVVLGPLCYTAIWLAKRRWQAMLALLASVGSVVCMLLTLSRGALVALGVQLVAGAVILRRKAIVPAIFCVVVLGGFSITPFGQEYFDRIERKIEENRITSGRTEIWAECINLFKAHPWVGSGLGSTRLRTGNSVYFEMDVEAHSWFFGALAETGILGLAAMMALWMVLAEDLIRQLTGRAGGNGEIRERPMILGLVLAFLGLSIHALLEPTLTGAPFFILFCMLVAVVDRLRTVAGSNEPA